MPYIPQEDRPFYNAIVCTILSRMHCVHISFNLNTEASILSKKLKSVDLLAQDGQLNYFMTKLCIEAGFLGKAVTGTEADVIEKFLIKVLRKVYPRKYVHYNRAVGTLTTCGKEFVRIFGEEGMGIKEFLDYIADSFYQDIVGPYEDEKIKANGKV